MNKIWRLVLALALLALAGVTLAGCERERPPLTPEGASTAAPARVTVAPLTTPVPAQTQVALPTSGAGGEEATPLPVMGTPTTSEPQPIVVNPGSPTGAPGQDAGEGYIIHTVVAGEWVTKIAEKYGVTVKAILELNDLANADVLMIGQQLKIPIAGAVPETPEPEGESKTYVVQQGDTLTKIATRYGVTVQQILNANNISDPDAIYPGQVLTIP